MDSVARVDIVRLEGGKPRRTADSVAIEQELVVTSHGRALLSCTSSPENLLELLYGHLLSEGIARTPKEVSAQKKPDGTYDLDLLATETPQRQIEPVKSTLSIPARVIIDTAQEFTRRAKLFSKTGGTHAASICHGAELINHFEDVSRTSALDKALGDALIRSIDTSDKWILLSSRVSRVIVQKIARCGVPLIAALSAPTLQAVEEGRRLGVCLCAFVRSERANIYANEWRVTF